ncbi:hypothetical protein [Rhizobium paknamense]|uniref:ATP-dependent protease HslVU (ClpYQ) peptidase subunit n=1 Tax=Rhizobium paknamense TaxID=1206817 RepID=A0ABU0I911_9HYPH|nr:hypothetical protein [Rhizobium paknamense]MDQ0454725.1 ATP-dependent protease HslVU (ClpYQ) peptidase subunit [Rhizobium paknamense]
MTDLGVRTPNITSASVLDTVLGNRGGSSRQISVDDLNNQMAGSGAIAASLASIAAKAAGKWISFDTQATMDANLAYAADTEARVYGTGAGIYKKVGDSGSGSWSYVGPLPEADTTELGPIVPGVFENVQGQLILAGGVTLYRGDRNRELGVVIPVGQTAAGAALVYDYAIDRPLAAQLANRTLRITMAFDVSGPFTRTFTPGLNIADQAGNVEANAFTLISNTSPSTYRRIVVMETSIPADTTTIEPYVLLGGSAAATEEYAVLSGLYLAIVTTTSDVATLASDNAQSGYKLGLMAGMPDIGSVFNDCQTVMFVNNGGQFREDASGKVIGWTIPAGSTGQYTTLTTKLPLSDDETSLLAYQTIEVVYLLSTSVAYDVPMTIVLQVDGVSYPSQVTRNQRVAPSQRVISVEGAIPADAKVIQPYIQSTGSAALATAQWIEIADMSVKLTGSLDKSRPPARLTAYWSSLRNRERAETALETGAIPEAIRPASITVDLASGASISTAITANRSPTKYRRRRFNLSSGTYAGGGLFPVMYDSFVGHGANRTIIDGSLAANTALATISNQSAFESYYDCDYYGFTVIAKNCRYAMHSDLAYSDKVEDVRQRIKGVRLVHLGNQEAIDYQNSIGGAPTDVWASTMAFGIGAWSGWDILVEDSELAGKFAAAGLHNNRDFTRPARWAFKNSKLVAETGTYALRIGNFGSKIKCSVLLEGNSFSGDILMETTQWFQDTLDYQPADHTEIMVTGHGNSPAVFKVSDFGRALKIESAATAGASTIAVSGSAVAVLFGTVNSKPGSGGIKGYVYGDFDISGHVVGVNSDQLITSLGKRLGNCAVTNKILTISVNGGVGINVVFNADYTNATNATILGMINSALGSAATASEYAIGERYRPMIADEEQSLQNVSAYGILMGMACAYTSDGSRSIRAMTSDDPVSLFAGVAWEDIYPGSYGRVKTAGFLPIGDILRTDAVALQLGTALSIDSAAPGYFKAGGATTVLTAIRSDAVRVVTAETMVALGGSVLQGPAGAGIPSSGGDNGDLLGYSGGQAVWRSPAEALSDIGAAPVASPAFTGTPTAPTPATATSTTQIATTAFVQAVVAALVNSAPAQLDTINELAAALGNDANFATTVTNALANKQPLDPTLTALAALTVAADKLIYATGADAFSTTDFTSVARTLLSAATQAAQRAALGLGTAATQSTGTSGANVPLLNGTNTWTGQQLMAGFPVKQSNSGGEVASARGFRQLIDGSEYLALYHDNTAALLTIQGTSKVQISGSINSMLQPLQIPSYTVATVPTASSYPRCMIYVSDGASSKRLAISDGSNWRFPDGAVIS